MATSNLNSECLRLVPREILFKLRSKIIAILRHRTMNLIQDRRIQELKLELTTIAEGTGCASRALNLYVNQR